MKMNQIVFVVLAIFSIPAIVLAAPGHPGAYVSGFMGVSVPSGISVPSTDFVINQSSNDQVEFDPNINIGATAGYDFGIIRLEGELSYKHAEISSITDQSDGFRFRNVDGNLGATAVLFNAFFDLHNSSQLTPYVGGGIGFASLHLSDTFGLDTRGGTARDLLLYGAGDSTLFAYQAGAGLDIALNRRLSLDIGYRYFATDRGDFDSNVATTSSMRFVSHNAALGLRYLF